MLFAQVSQIDTDFFHDNGDSNYNSDEDKLKSVINHDNRDNVKLKD